MPRVETNDIETYYESDGEGPPIVFVHGAWVDHRLWMPQVEALSNEYRVITYDLRGHGRTGSSADRNYTIELLAADLRALIGSLDLARPVVCGLSLGGMVAQLYAVRYDELPGLVLADTAVSTRLTRSDRLQRLLFPDWSMRGTVRLLGPERYVDWAFRLAKYTRSADWFGRDAAVQEYVRETMSAFETREFNAVFDAIYGFRRTDLAAIDAPTLVVNGEFESRSVFEHAAYIERTVPDARSVVVPEAGHVANLENPEAFARELRTFLGSLPARGNGRK
ncbi:MAG: alpha/beta fold hydrolase [Halalkalicoccus sp.]